MTTVKKRKHIDNLSPAEKYRILELYKEGISYTQIGSELGVTKSTCKQFIHTELRNLNNIHETNSLITTQLNVSPRYDTKELHKDIQDLLEDGAGNIYAYYFAHTGDNLLSLKESKLDLGIVKPKGNVTTSVTAAYRLRGMYLREIAQIKQEIERIREEKFRDNPVTKPYVQSLLIEQIEELKELAVDNIRLRGNISRNIELLGKSIGAFVEKVEVQEISPDQAIDTLIAMSKAEYEITDVN